MTESRFRDVDGLRGIAALAIVAYQVERFAGLPVGTPPAFARVFQAAGEGLTLFLAISAFSLAYPVFAARRGQDAGRSLDVGRYVASRFVRIYPAFLTVVLVTAALHPIASLIRLPSLADGAAPFDLAVLARSAVFFGGGLGNDGLRAVELYVRFALVFPFALALYGRLPLFSVALGIAAAYADVMTAAHGSGVGALLPLVLGIAAADLRASGRFPNRVRLPAVILTVAAAFFTDPLIAGLPGASVAPDALPIGPLWALAACFVLSGTRSSGFGAGGAAVPPLRALGTVSYALSLTAMPVAAFAVSRLPMRFGPIATAGIASIAALLVGVVLWLAVDRPFATSGTRRRIADVPGGVLDRILALLRLNRVALRPIAASAAPDPDDGIGDVSADATAALALEQSPEPRIALTSSPAPAVAPARPAGPMAVLSLRAGSADDLAAEIRETKRRLADQAANAAVARAAEAERAATPDVVQADAAGDDSLEDDDTFDKPGFYRRPGTRRVGPAPEPRPLPAVATPPARIDPGSETPASAGDAASREDPEPQPGPIRFRIGPVREQGPGDSADPNRSPL